MADRGWHEDSDYHEAVQRAERATRFGWSAIAWSTGAFGALGCVLITVAVLSVVAVIACLFVVVASHY